jgi:hypothetical protein
MLSAVKHLVLATHAPRLFAALRVTQGLVNVAGKCRDLGMSTILLFVENRHIIGMRLEFILIDPRYDSRVSSPQTSFRTEW